MLTPSPRRRATRLTALAALAALAAGCSGSSGGAAVDSTTAASTATTAATSTAAPSTSRATAAPTTASRRTTSTAAATTTAPATTTPAVVTPDDGATSVTVASAAAKYHVLFLKPVLAGTVELPVAIARGTAGTATLTDGRRALSPDHYRVETFDASAPGDVDGDGIDDLTELDDPLGNPLNPAPKMDPATTGAIVVPDVDTYSELSYQGNNVGRDSYLAGLEVMKFIITGANTDRLAVYFMNTNRYNAHPVFAGVVGIQGIRGGGPSAGVMRGDVVYEPNREAADGTKGVYRFAFQPNDAYSFREIALAYEVLTTNMPFLRGNLAYYAFPNAAYPLYLKEKALYDAYRVTVIKGDA